MEILCLEDLVLQLDGSLPCPHIPQKSKILIQIIVEDLLLYQTNAVDCRDAASTNPVWHLRLCYDVPRNVSRFTLAIVCEYPPADVARVLGSVQIQTGPLFETLRQRQERSVVVSRPVVAVDADAPPISLSTTFSLLAKEVGLAIPAPSVYRMSLDADAIRRDLMKNQASDISLMYERILLSPNTEHRAKRLLRLGTLASDSADSSIDLRRAIMIYEDGLLEANRTLRPDLLVSLGMCLASLYEKTHDVGDLNGAVQMQEDALKESSKGKHILLGNVGQLLLTRFERMHDLSDLNRSIQLLQEALALTHDDEEKSELLGILGTSFTYRFERMDASDDLNQSITFKEDAISLISADHPDRPALLMNLGGSLLLRFEHSNNDEDLRRSVQVREQAVDEMPENHPNRPSALTNLGASLMRQFEHLGNLADLNRAIQLQEEAVMLSINNDPDKPSYLNNFAASLYRRFSYLDDLGDLQRSISARTEAVSLVGDHHRDKALLLNNLGNCILARFDRLGNADDLYTAIQLQDDAVGKIQDKEHSDYPYFLNSLAVSLRRRFEHQPSLSLADLTRAVELHRESIRLMKNGHPDKPNYVDKFAYTLLLRFKRDRNLPDLTESIKLREDTLPLIPDEHPDRSSFLNNLGFAYLTRYREQERNAHDARLAISFFQSSAQSVSGSPYVKFSAAAAWLDCLRLAIDDDASPDSKATMVASSQALKLIPELAWPGCTIPDRHHRLLGAGRTVRDAAAVAIDAGDLATAVAWLEQGRSVIWDQLLRLRTTPLALDSLRKLEPELANRLELLSSQLADTSGLPNQKSNQDYHAAAVEREEILMKIRQMPGFETFLQPKTLSELLPAASRGPVVLVNVSHIRCDALVLRPQGVLHVPLTEYLIKDALIARKCLQLALHNERVSQNDIPARERKASRVADPETSVLSREQIMKDILEDLWVGIVEPVLKALEIKEHIRPNSKNIQRIWWCLTGPLSFLPVHAAGVYPSGPKLADYAVSSYTPSVTALLKKIQVQSQLQSPPPLTKRRILTVALPELSVPRLLGTAEEFKIINERVKKLFDPIPLLESAAQADSVSEAMTTAHWAHFACHGMQSLTDPTESCLALAVGSKLSLAEIIRLTLRNAEFAFLSACETAAGDHELEDESVHLAAGMLLAGYRGLVATMWSINDKVAVRISDETYKLLLEDYGADSLRAAEALHFAVNNVRKDLDEKLMFSWISFVHMGL